MTWTLCKHGGPSPAEKALAAELTAARSRIAALEDWQRRALGTGLLEEHGGCSCTTCNEVRRLREEATR